VFFVRFADRVARIRSHTIHELDMSGSVPPCVNHRRLNVLVFSNSVIEHEIHKRLRKVSWTIRNCHHWSTSTVNSTPSHSIYRSSPFNTVGISFDFSIDHEYSRAVLNRRILDEAGFNSRILA